MSTNATDPLHRIDFSEGRYEPAMFNIDVELNAVQLKQLAKNHGFDLRLKVEEWEGEAAEIMDNDGKFSDALEATAPEQVDQHGYQLVGAWDSEDGDLVLAYVHPLGDTAKAEA